MLRNRVAGVSQILDAALFVEMLGVPFATSFFSFLVHRDPAAK
jgi:hypothetical protein